VLRLNGCVSNALSCLLSPTQQKNMDALITVSHARLTDFLDALFKLGLPGAACPPDRNAPFATHFVTSSTSLRFWASGQASTFSAQSVPQHLLVQRQISNNLGQPRVLVIDADSDQFARLFRSDLARDSDPISQTVSISNRPGTRAFQHVDFLALVMVVGQPFLVCLERARRMLSPASSMRWALWTRRSSIASA
jgi:hypothetical protein